MATILCDLDGIVVDLLGPWLEMYNRKWGDNLTVDKITEFELHKFVKPECGQNIYDFIDTGEAYRHLRPLPGALAAIHQLERHGHDVIIVSAGAKNLATAGHKLEWCKKHLGFSRKKCIIAHRKELVRGDVFIDDSPVNIARYRRAWPDTPIYTIAYPYNESVGHLCHRFQGWRDPAAAWDGILRAIESAALLSA
jgi:5'(3')-deoxyribonucleotidase